MMDETIQLIADGVRAERTGAYERALEAFRLAVACSDNPAICAEALTHEADVLRAQCDWDNAILAARRAQGIAWEADLADKYLEALNAEANVLSARGRFDEARPILERVAAGSTDARLRGIALQNIGTIHAQNGQHGTAQRAFTQSLANFQKAGYQRGECIALNNLGRLALDAGDCAGAAPLLHRAFAIAREIEDHELTALARLNLAWSLCPGGSLDEAQDHAMAALGHFASCENRWREIECFRLIGDINERCEDWANAERCFGIALSLAEQIGSEPEVRATRERLSGLAQQRSRSVRRPSPPGGAAALA
jgi:tetratricopeptide (TPR) repeat protein